jgi:hypothetical protein
MKNIILLFLFSCCSLFSQNSVVKEYYSNGQVSVIKTPTHFNPDSSDWLFRIVKVYSYSGALVWEGSERKVAGHATVYLKFHKNGGVKQLDYSSHPDGGIQWQKETLKMDTLGNITFRVQASNEDMLRPYPFQQEIITCSVPYATKYFIENGRRKKIRINEAEKKLKKRDRAEIKTVMYSNQFRYLQKDYTVLINGKKLELQSFESDTITNGTVQEITFLYR